MVMKAVDPENKKRDGDVVRLGDAVFLTDDRNYVWRDNVSKNSQSLYQVLNLYDTSTR